MENEKKTTQFYKTSVSVRISEEHQEQWDDIDKPSRFVNDLIADYFNNKISKVSLPKDVEAKFNEYDMKEYLINKLLTEYFRDNVIFVDDFIKVNTLQQKVGIASQNRKEDAINKRQIPKQVNPIIVPETEGINNIPTNSNTIEEISVEEVDSHENNNINEDNFKISYETELNIVENNIAGESVESFPLLNDNIFEEDKTENVVSVSDPATKKNRNILFKRR